MGVVILLVFVMGVVAAQDPYRLQVHFSIAKNWINDPNGMVYLDGEYHLQYQYYPDGTTWGPMHWGHSISTDLVHWTDLPITLYPDPLGDIFSGSAVADLNNTSGFQDGENVPIVAIFTHAGASQQQSIAYSTDKGRTFTKFEGNPVIPNPGIGDFRDPKVIRYEDSWILVLAAGNRIMFYKSSDLKEWVLVSEFGTNPDQGSHGGVWECPDLLQFNVEGEAVWVLIVSINPGGPNGGSATQYFIGDFDGERFISDQIDPLWMDWGVDNYAAVGFHNDPFGRHILMGWMSNWDYANELPTGEFGWRGQMTLPRLMGLQTLPEGQLRLTSQFAPEVHALYQNNSLVDENRPVAPDSKVEIQLGIPLLHATFTFETENMADGTSLAICYLNSLQQEVCTGYDKGQASPLFLNRELSGRVDFKDNFSRRVAAAREISSTEITFEIIMDLSAGEVLVDGGLTAMTALFYPDEPYTKIEIRHIANGNQNSELLLKQGAVQGMNSIY